MPVILTANILYLSHNLTLSCHSRERRIYDTTVHHFYWPQYPPTYNMTVKDCRSCLQEEWLSTRTKVAADSCIQTIGLCHHQYIRTPTLHCHWQPICLDHNLPALQADMCSSRRQYHSSARDNFSWALLNSTWHTNIHVIWQLTPVCKQALYKTIFFLGIEKSTIMTYHPQTNLQTES